jgi:hypothetical protein
VLGTIGEKADGLEKVLDEDGLEDVELEGERSATVISLQAPTKPTSNCPYDPATEMAMLLPITWAATMVRASH